MSTQDDGIQRPDFPPPVATVIGWERQDEKPARIAKKDWRPIFTRHTHLEA